MERFILVAALSLILPQAKTLAADKPAAAGKSASAPTELLAESDALLRTWVPAEFPADVASDVQNGSATVRVVVNEKGAIVGSRVLEASAPAFGDAALAAAKQWTFTPAVVNGKYAASCLDIPFEFTRGKPTPHTASPRPDLMPRAAPPTQASLADGPLGDYPATLVGRGLPGEVQFHCLVDAAGRASHLTILRASHPDFVLAAIAAFPAWRFEPAKQGDLPIATEMVGEVSYSDTKTPERSAVLQANGITAPDGSVPDAPPQPTKMTDPIWPYDAAINGKGGAASVEFTVGTDGATSNIVVREATTPAFGAALAAAVATWNFEPAIVDGKAVEVRLLKKAEFTVPAADASPDDWNVRLVKAIKAGTITGGRGLDARLTPVYRAVPVKPASLAEGAKGEAVVEFIIDRDGRGRLPRIVSATNDECGWAAATAASQWVFTPPTRGGKPTEVRVQVPMEF
jgi:TonB family protein